MISENMLRKSGKIGKIIYKIGENRNFHIVSIDTASAPGGSLIFTGVVFTLPNIFIQEYLDVNSLLKFLRKPNKY